MSPISKNKKWLLNGSRLSKKNPYRRLSSRFSRSAPSPLPAGTGGTLTFGLRILLRKAFPSNRGAVSTVATESFKVISLS